VNRISAVVITLNEEHSLSGALDSVAWCDEIVVLDSGSVDGTVEIARSYPNCRVLHQPFLGYGPQKRKAVEAASNDWILSLDADEVLDELLQQSLRAWRESGSPGEAGYYLLRRLCFMGRHFRHGRESRDRVLRLFDRRRGNFNEANIHERVELDGPTGVLSGRLLHYSYRDLDEYFEKFNRYTSVMARQMRQRGRRSSIPSLVLRQPVSFLNYYLVRGNWMNGFPGFVWSLLAATYRTVKYLKLYELQTTAYDSKQDPPVA
jgi:glycosyltransferase involved in cell wall biosynthesis